jgi:ribosomal protein S18 acetylase RimI-like enzyme
VTPGALTLVDLDQRPDLGPAVLALFSASPPGADHLVCGLPAYMGLPASAEALGQAAGVLIALVSDRPVGALALCPYSEEQITLWGPAVAKGAAQEVGPRLIHAAREALHLSPYGSLRALADLRNRRHRTLLLTHGFTSWKDNYFYERLLAGESQVGTSRVRRATVRDHGVLATIFIQGFPDSDHCIPSLQRRETEGYRHYLLEDNGVVAAAAAVQDAGGRGWLKLVAMRSEMRGKHLSKRLLDGVLAEEAKRRTHAIALEVLADNAPAIHLYESVGFKRRWTATIFTGPV